MRTFSGWGKLAGHRCYFWGLNEDEITEGPSITKAVLQDVITGEERQPEFFLGYGRVLRIPLGDTDSVELSLQQLIVTASEALANLFPKQARITQPPVRRTGGKVYRALLEAGPCCGTDLAEAIGLPKHGVGTIISALNRLQQRGLAVKLPGGKWAAQTLVPTKDID